jgi:uncharacterized SAM-binding protein YcdF (DUF218 family)
MSFEKIDAILTLGGEDPIMRQRSNRTYQLLNELAHTRIGGAYAILSGYCSGLVPKHQRPNLEDAEAYQMAEYLQNRGVANRQLFVEADSLDTIANFVKSRKYIDHLGARNIAVVADKVGMPRVLQTARYVLGTRYKIIPEAIDEGNNGFSSKFREKVICLANMLDFQRFSLDKFYVDHDDWELYLSEMHPFHGSNVKRHFTFYGFPAFVLSFGSNPNKILSVYQRNSKKISPANIDDLSDIEFNCLFKTDNENVVIATIEKPEKPGNHDLSEEDTLDMDYDDFFEGGFNNFDSEDYYEE